MKRPLSPLLLFVLTLLSLAESLSAQLFVAPVHISIGANQQFQDYGINIYNKNGMPTNFVDPEISVSRNNDILTYSINGSEDVDRITIFRDGTLINWSWKGNNVNSVSLPFSDDYWVSLVGKNKIPYIAKLPVIREDEFIQNVTIDDKISISGKTIKLALT